MPLGRTPHWSGWKSGRSKLQQLGEPGNWWVNTTTDGTIRALLRLQPTQDGRVEITAALFERQDGAPLAVRDITGAHLGELSQAAQQLRGWMTDTTDPDSEQLLSPLKEHRKPKRSGRVTSPDHYRVVWELWLTAQEIAPTRPVAWMREKWPEDVPWPTMTRWLETARNRYEETQ